ncbi:aldehyde dehydrogenase (NADP(+)) [Algibacter mikhailovii]|uniref:Fatty aldehyde dehydrogenase n=1 Tax=Algibacter mikhailovii TaxID=425498 RepID=A0A918QRM2_9FLAO|nr:aldehyde dehydrogenase (NADP(+)) [Algibacter mikhailovii]GGZ69640.1 fatty aldehyde dehydrogenase [Algibacter mikhailovii]
MSTNTTFQATNPSTNELLDGEFINATAAGVDEAVRKASIAFNSYRKKDKESIANFLDQIADEILNLGDALLERCHLETGLPLGRLQGERGRTMNQLKLFATVVREGSWVDARIDTALPERNPMPRADIRHMLIPLGPVAVFGASNFPLAFSTAGGDTASALAAGCPVVVKGHPAHPGTADMIDKAIQKAIKACDMPEGTFTLIHGNSIAVGEALVKHPDIKAVGFTGSHAGGIALFKLANNRPEPIPVFSEMGSTNPVFILPRALKQKGEEIAGGMADSVALGVGQFCTNPGLVFAQKSDALESYKTAIKNKVSEFPAGIMLTPGIKQSYDAGVSRTLEINEVDDFAAGLNPESPNSGTSRIFKTSIENFLRNASLAEENFGPSSVLVEATNKADLLEAAQSLKGHLTASVFGTDEDFEEHKDLIDVLELKVGRVVVNGYPTGVEVCHAMVHGGPYPATTAPQSTSVGTNAIKRFVRPICFQSYPKVLLPEELKDDNPLNIWRLVNGEFTKA